MAQANIFGFPNSQAHSPRNAFDMSYQTLFNSPCGMLLPAYIQEVKAGDYLKLSCKNFTRTKPLNTAAFASFDEKVDFFFVPYRLLWSSYNQWRLGTTQNRSTIDLQDIGRLTSVPCGLWSNFLVDDSSVTNGKTLACIKPGGSYKFGVTYFAAMCRFLDLFGYGLLPIENITRAVAPGALGDPSSVISNIANHFTKLGENFKFNYFRLAAYQCIYQYAYRNEDFEPLDPSYYNCDSLFLNQDTYSNNSLIPSRDPVNSYNSKQSSPTTLFHGYPGDGSVGYNTNRITLYKLFEPRYKNYRRDLFSTIKPTNGIIPSQSQSGFYGSTNVVVSPFDNSATDTPYSETTDFQPTLALASVTAQQVRNLFAQDKFTRLAIYANKDYRSLYKSIFGIEVDEPDVPRYLGTFSSNVVVNEVVATSAGNDSDPDNPQSSILGELAGKGIGSNDAFVFKSDFKEDGIVMGIHYIIPYNNYAPYRFDAFNMKSSRFDYYYPSFDGLGLQPVLTGEYSYWLSDSALQTPNEYGTLLGYNTRFHEYKQRTNCVHGSFAPNQSESHWAVTLNDEMVANPKYLFKVNPNVTDRIFGVNWDGTPNTDPFYCLFSFNATLVSNMEAVGVPNT